MLRGRGFWHSLAAGLVLGCAVLFTAPAAAAAAPCGGAFCYRYYADITITAWTNPSIPIPVFPGSTHTYTVRVTNTGWRTGGASAPVPGIGPDSGPVYIGIEPSSPDEFPVGHTDDSGVPFRCQGYHANGLACDTSSIPSGSTAQFTVTFQAPRLTGTYTCAISAYALNWTEYNPNNNGLTVTYQVGYLA
jgi:hypothetical protein